MFRIKLPGNQKTKNIVLAILVIISIILLIVIAFNNKDTESKDDVNNNTAISSLTNNNNNISNDKIDEKKEQLSKQQEEEYQKAFDAFHSSKYEEAIKIADEIIKNNPNNYKAYSIRGIAKAYNKNFADGMKDIDKALEIKNDYGYGLFNKALAYELYGNFDEALIWYDNALKVEQYLWSYYGKASIFGRRGDVKNTVKYLTKALEMAKQEGNESKVKEIIKEESDFNNVRNSDEFKKLIY